MLKRWLAGLLGGLLICGSALAADAWTTYATVGASIEMPGPAKVGSETSQAGDIAFISTSGELETADGYYALVDTIYEAESLGDPWVVLSNAAAGAAKSSGGVIVSQERKQVSGSPALDVVVERKADNIRLRSVLVVRGVVLYNAIAVGVGDLPPGSDRFFGSFRLTDPGA